MKQKQIVDINLILQLNCPFQVIPTNFHHKPQRVENYNFELLQTNHVEYLYFTATLLAVRVMPKNIVNNKLTAWWYVINVVTKGLGEVRVLCPVAVCQHRWERVTPCVQAKYYNYIL